MLVNSNSTMQMDPNPTIQMHSKLIMQASSKATIADGANVFARLRTWELFVRIAAG